MSLVALLLYTYPAFVTIAALALGRLAPSPRIGAALALASAGLVLVLVAAGTGAFDVTGALMAIGASLTYTTYILVSDGIVGDVDPFALALLVLTGATVSFSVVGLTTGSIDFALPAEAWLWLVLIALVSTVVAVSAFFAGLRRVGPSEAAILSTFEPPVTVALAFAVLGERLSVVQLAGGALVLAAVVLSAAAGAPGGRPGAGGGPGVGGAPQARAGRCRSSGSGSPLTPAASATSARATPPTAAPGWSPPPVPWPLRRCRSRPCRRPKAAVALALYVALATVAVFVPSVADERRPDVAALLGLVVAILVTAMPLPESRMQFQHTRRENERRNMGNCTDSCRSNWQSFSSNWCSRLGDGAQFKEQARSLEID